MRHFFPALYGNEKTKNLIGRDILEKKQHHAYILEGPTGSGKHVLACEIAKALLCLRKDVPAFPCGTCLQCKKMDAQSHTDIAYVNSGDKASLAVETVRETLATLSYAPDEGNYKIYIFEDAQKMTVQAQNALLLSLEEPPPYAVFILLVTDAAALLETIRSRATIFSMQQFTNDSIFTYLEQTGIQGTKERLREAADASGGIIGTAKAFLLGEDATAGLRTAADEWICTLCTKTVTEALVYCSQIKFSRTEFDTFLIYAMAALRDRIAIKLGGKELLFYQQASQIQDAPGNTLARLNALYDALYDAREEIVRSNASPYPILCTLTERHFRQI
ncbi:MAG: hypothetical protein HFE66_08975 [Clostridiales bacterium]|jgi:DNA polymerase-3 subunit delta'|nr:hypothetical protein [Clostridiales bacterium]